MARGEYLGAKEFNKRLSELMDRVIRSIPEAGDLIAEEISQKAVKYAKSNIETGANMDGHSEHTESLTKNLRGEETKNVLNESGELKNSIHVVEKLFSRDSIIIVIGSDVEYASYHEEGFTTRIPISGKEYKVSARPFLKPAVEKAIKNSFSFGLESRIRKALKAKASGKNWKKFFKWEI